jgi:hypothetical protein
MPGVRVIIHEVEMRRLLSSPSGPVIRDMLRRGVRVQAKARRFVGVDTGRLRSSITVSLVAAGTKIAVRVGTNVQYALWHHEGTGIYGPRHQPIRPVRAKVLVFKPKGSSVTVFARQVRGQPGTKFLTRALGAAS